LPIKSIEKLNNRIESNRNLSSLFFGIISFLKKNIRFLGYMMISFPHFSFWGAGDSLSLMDHIILIPVFHHDQKMAALLSTSQRTTLKLLVPPF